MTDTGYLSLYDNECGEDSDPSLHSSDLESLSDDSSLSLCSDPEQSTSSTEESSGEPLVDNCCICLQEVAHHKEVRVASYGWGHVTCKSCGVHMCKVCIHDLTPLLKDNSKGAISTAFINRECVSCFFDAQAEILIKKIHK
jgi:hypothetical protein